MKTKIKYNTWQLINPDGSVRLMNYDPVEQLKKEIKDKEKKVNIMIIEGVEGKCIVVNDIIICGNKPFGGGKVIDSWNIKLNNLADVIRCIEESKIQNFIEKVKDVVNEGHYNWSVTKTFKEIDKLAEEDLNKK